jgi:hypothetical protein
MNSFELFIFSGRIMPPHVIPDLTPKQKSPPKEDFFVLGFLVDDYKFFLEQRAY